ncbi:hypothetical protein VTL71DRAFT_2218 [Oculimacula yallundae]|uniref:Uncharacterized protein n=1 Tax=Oculimacula yallundae TaxID=86028 RepID=A0ABR4C914_9HELO
MSTLTPSTLSKVLLYTASLANLGSVIGHTAMGYEIVFPALNKLLGVNGKGVDGKGVNVNGKEAKKDRDGAVSARIGWMEVNSGFVILSIFCIKWAQLGIVDVYDKVFVSFYCLAQAYFGWCYIKAGIVNPVAVLWGIPALVGVSQLV